MATAFLLLAMVSASGQMRGARGGGAAVSRGGVAPARVAPSFSPSRFNGQRGYSFNGGAARSNALVRSVAPSRRWNGGAGFGFSFGHGSRPYRHRYGYYPSVYPYYAYPYAYVGAYPDYGFGYYDSGVYSSYSTNSDSEYYQQQQQLNAEIGSLNQQIEDLRDQNDSLRDYVESSRSVAPAPPAPDRGVPQSLQQPMQTVTPPAPATVLVFRDGHQVEVHNYAIVGKTLWALSERRSEKYPLADLDLDKTAKENEKRGVEFTAPLP
jgi:hypothetical protein